MNHTSAPTHTSWRDRLLTFWARRNWRGLIKLKRLVKPVGGRSAILSPTCYGTRFHLSLWDSVDTHVMREGFYESEVIEAIRPCLTGKPAVLWVVGANFGLHAITLKCLYPATRVIAFEPSPAMAARLIENAELNRADIELHAYALSDSDGIRTFHANTSGNPGMSTLHPSAGFRYDQRFHVGVWTPAAVIASLTAPSPDAMLIDAEGAEEAILHGFGEELSRGRIKTLIFEADGCMLETKNHPLLKLVRDSGFTVTKLTRREATAHSLDNYLAVRP